MKVLSVVTENGARLSHCYFSRYVHDDNILYEGEYDCNLPGIRLSKKIECDMYYAHDFFQEQRDKGVTSSQSVSGEDPREDGAACSCRTTRKRFSAEVLSGIDSQRKRNGQEHSNAT